ncbi:MAG: hypothetical protein FWH54_06775 [Methanobrevibacter sp.]|nr:hypothetical protein [Methanobrevibacter sp.]
MYCQNHPNKESVATCVVCGKSICEDCGLNIADKDYCHECVTEIVATGDSNRTKTRGKLQNNSDKSLEKKYERYLDELYYKEDNVSSNENTIEVIPLKEQLAMDEAANGSIISKPRQPTEPTPDKEIPQKNTDKFDLKSVTVSAKDNNKKNRRSLHPHIQNEQKKKKEKEGESTTTEIILTLILIFLIILVVSYIIYLFTLAQAYPNFFDAVYALFSNPAEIINNIFS